MFLASLKVDRRVSPLHQQRGFLFYGLHLLAHLRSPATEGGVIEKAQTLLLGTDSESVSGLTNGAALTASLSLSRPSSYGVQSTHNSHSLIHLSAVALRTLY